MHHDGIGTFTPAGGIPVHRPEDRRDRVEIPARVTRCERISTLQCLGDFQAREDEGRVKVWRSPGHLPKRSCEFAIRGAPVPRIANPVIPEDDEAQAPDN